MRPRRILAPPDTAAIFDRAVQERALAVLTLQCGPEWHTFKARFLERDARGQYFVLDHHPVDDEPLPEVAPGQYVGVSFRQKSRKLLFGTIVEARGHFTLENEQRVPAVRYRWPESMTELQRRAYLRTPIPPETTLLASMWPGGVAARATAQGNALEVVPGELLDLSCGGTLVRLYQPQAPTWREDLTLGVELQLPDGRPPILVDAHYRGARPEQFGMLSVALQFVGLEVTVDGRLVLQRLASAVQRLHRLQWAASRRPASDH